MLRQAAKRLVRTVQVQTTYGGSPPLERFALGRSGRVVGAAGGGGGGKGPGGGLTEEDHDEEDEDDPSEPSTRSDTDCPWRQDARAVYGSDGLMQLLVELANGGTSRMSAYCTSDRIPPSLAAPLPISDHDPASGVTTVGQNGILASAFSFLENVPLVDSHIAVDGWFAAVAEHPSLDNIGTRIRRYLALDSNHQIVANVLSTLEQARGVRDGHRTWDIERIKTFSTIPGVVTVHVRCKTLSDLALGRLRIAVYSHPKTYDHDRLVSALQKGDIDTSGWVYLHRPRSERFIDDWLQRLRPSDRSAMKRSYLRPRRLPRLHKGRTFWGKADGICQLIWQLDKPTYKIDTTIETSMRFKGDNGGDVILFVAAGLASSMDEAKGLAAKFLQNHGRSVEKSKIGAVHRNVPRGIASAARRGDHATAGAQMAFAAVSKRCVPRSPSSIFRIR